MVRAGLLTAVVALLLLAAAWGSFNRAQTAGPSSSPIATPSPSPSPSPVQTSRPSPSASPTPAPSPTESPGLYVEIIGSDYGFIFAQTWAGAVCNARAVLPNGQDAPGLINPQVSDAQGNVGWMYPTPVTDNGTEIHIVTCIYNGLSGTVYGYVDLGS